MREILLESDVGEWTETADLIIVGGGIAGLSAAVQGRESGLDILVIERAFAPGGSSALAGGQMYLGGGTPVQKACGFEDSVEDMYEYLKMSCPVPADEKCRIYAESSLEQFDWLEKHGVPFERSFFSGKAAMQHGTECLIWSGNELVREFRERARPAPRGHKVSFVGVEGGGSVIINALIDAYAKLDGRLMCETRVSALVKDSSGRVIGVRAESGKQSRFYRASEGVLLTTGAYTLNPDMLARYNPKMLAKNIIHNGAMTDTGDGHQLGEAAGGQLVNMEYFFITSPFYPPEKLLKGILVNAAGKRFVTEDSYHGRSAARIIAQPEGKAWLIVDNDVFDYPANYKRLNHELVDAWDSVPEMEAALGIPAGALQETIETYNADAAQGEDKQFGKEPKWLKPLDKPPYAAFNLQFESATYITFTLGGLATSIDAEVLDSAGVPIPGLFAAGQAASNIAQDSDGYSSGSCLGEGSIFGRRAARRAASLKAGAA
jgi:succinate dehydrogenase/fumarate reductase flavoprotein subunit